MDEDFKRDLDMMENPDRWPRVFLPLKRWRGSRMDVGLLLADEEANYMFFRDQSMFDDLNFTKVERMTKSLLPALLAEGWRVD